MVGGCRRIGITNQLILSSVSPVPISLANIHSIGMISGSLLPPTSTIPLDVTQVPEPNSLALLGFRAAWACLVAGCSVRDESGRPRRHAFWGIDANPTQVRS